MARRQINIRLSDDHYLELRAKAQAAGMSMSELLRDHAEKIAVVNRTDWRLRTYQLGRIGTNLNQIAHWANTYKTTTEAHHVVVALLRLERLIRDEYGLDQGAPSQ